MKVTFDDIIYEIQNAGGISKYWAKLSYQLSLNKDIEAINLQGRNAKSNIFFNMKTKNKINYTFSIPSKIKRYFPPLIKHDCDIFHSSYYRTPMLRNQSVKQVVTVHDFMYELFDGGMKKKIHIWQKSKAILNADAVICVSEHTKKDLMRFYPQIKRDILYVVPNGVDEEFKVLPKKNTKKEFLLYVGSRVGCKNFSFIPELMLESSLIKEKQFDVFCVGGGKFSKNELEIFQAYGLEERFKHFDNIDNDELNILYNHAYALLFPSKYEGFGIPVLEAQVAGCPVLYAKTSSLPEVMAYSDLGHTLNNVNEASLKLNQLEDKAFREKIVSKGMKFASKLTWKNTANLTYKVYKEIL